VELARGRGYRILSRTAAGAETQLSFTGLLDLVGDAFDEVEDDLPGQAVGRAGRLAALPFERIVAAVENP